MRWWIPLTILGLAVVSGVVLYALEVPFLEPIFIAVSMLVVILLGVWFTFFTGLRWRTRGILALTGVGVVVGVWLTVSQLTRVEGSIGGSGVPRLVWKWKPKLEGAERPVLVASSVAEPEERTPAEFQTERPFPQFLGPDRTAVLTGIPLRRDWQRWPPELKWKQPIGLGWSAFAVSGRHAITQEQRRDDELVVCYDVQSGNALWVHTNRNRFSEVLGGDGPRATPTIHNGRVFAMGASGILDCLDEAQGRLIWSRHVLAENNLSNVTWGKSCSPLLVQNLVVVTGGEQREKTLLAYDAETGNPVWQAGRDRASYASPVLTSLCGEEQLVVVNGHSVTGHALHHGTILWEYSWPADYAKVTQPIPVDTNRVFIAAGYGVGCAMLRVNRSEGGEWSVTELWKNRNLKPKFTNVVRKGNHVYGLDEGVLVCVNLETGGREWKEGRYGHGQVLLIDDLLLVQAEAGEVVLIEISPESPRELTRFPALKGKTWNNPVLAGDLLLVRNDQQAACYWLPLDR